MLTSHFLKRLLSSDNSVANAVRYSTSAYVHYPALCCSQLALLSRSHNKLNSDIRHAKHSI